MCRGLAILLDKHGKIVCRGLLSHSETAKTAKIEDSSLKYEIIVDDSQKLGFVVEIDSHYKKGENDFKEAVECLPSVKKWVAKNELQVLRGLLSCQSYAQRKGNTYNSWQKTKGDTYNSSQETEGNTDNSSQKTEGNTDNCWQKTKGDTNNSWQKTKGDTYNSYQETEGNTDNSSQKTEGNTNNSSQETKGNTDNSWQKTEGNTDNRSQETVGNTNNRCQKTKGDTNNSYQETGGEWYCGLLKLSKYPNTTKIVKQAKYDWDLTLPEFTRYCAENSEKVLKQLGNEGKTK